eukprot:582663-Rhodomonas_salina.1
MQLPREPVPRAVSGPGGHSARLRVRHKRQRVPLRGVVDRRVWGGGAAEVRPDLALVDRASRVHAPGAPEHGGCAERGALRREHDDGRGPGGAARGAFASGCFVAQAVCPDAGAYLGVTAYALDPSSSYSCQVSSTPFHCALCALPGADAACCGQLFDDVGRNTTSEAAQPQSPQRLNCRLPVWPYPAGTLQMRLLDANGDTVERVSGVSGGLAVSEIVTAISPVNIPAGGEVE